VSERSTSPRRRGPRSDAQRNDELILQAAARQLADDPNATMQCIADDAGVVRLTVYRRYRNRDALRRAIFETAASQAEQAIGTALDEQADTVTTLRRLIVAMAEIAHRYPLLSIGTDLEPQPTDARAPAAPPATRAMQEAVLALIRRGQSEGTLRADLPAELLPLAIVGTLRTTLRFARALNLDHAKIGTDVADLLLKGYAAPPSP
jgi:TetR/AcrR family transcriptional regulator, mexCD-oprJ operon repressor